MIIQQNQNQLVLWWLFLSSFVLFGASASETRKNRVTTEIHLNQYNEWRSERSEDIPRRALQATATLTMDLGSLPTSTDVFVTTVSTGEVTNFFRRTGLQTLSVPAEPLVVRVQDEGSATTFSREASVDCSSGECAVGPLISQLSVDLTGMPIGTDILIYTSEDTENALRSSFNLGEGSRGGQPKSFTLLGGSYVVEIVDDGTAVDFAKQHTVNCADGGSCALNRTNLTDVLTMDLTGLPSTTDVAIFEPSDTENAVRFVSNQGDGSSGGQPKTYTLLQSEYVVNVIYDGTTTDAVASYTVKCLGLDDDDSCSLTSANLTTTMSIDLSGLPRSTDVRVFVAGEQLLEETTTDNFDAGLVREFSNEGDDGTVGGQPKTYTLVPSTYEVEIVDDGSFDQRNRYNMTCLGGDVCSLSSEDLTATLTIDFTGLPSTTDLLIFSTQDTSTVLRTVPNQGGDDAQPRSYVLLKGEYIVEVIFEGRNVDYSREFRMSCFGSEDDFCSLSSSDLIATLTIDFTGLPSGTDLRISIDSQTETIELLQHFSDVAFGDQPKEYNLLQGNYVVEVIDDGSFVEYSRTFNMTCFGQENDFCSLTQDELSATMSIDLTGLPRWIDFYVYPSTTGDATNPLRSFSNQGSTEDQPRTFRVLHGEYLVIVEDQGKDFDYSRSFNLTCRGMEPEGCSVTASELSTTMSIDLTSLPSSTDVQIFSTLDPNNVFRFYSNAGGVTEQPLEHTLLQGDYIVEVIDDGYSGTTHSNTYNLTCAASCSLLRSDVSSTLTVDLTGLPFQTRVLIYHAAEPKEILRFISSQGEDETQPKTYTLLQGDYIIEIVDTSFDNSISNAFNVTCLNFEDDRCAVTKAMLTDTLTVDLTGLPYRTNIVIYRVVDSTTDAVRFHSKQGDSGDGSIQPVSYPLLQGEYVVEIVDNGIDNTYQRTYSMTCFGGEDDICSVTNSMLTATMTIDVTGLPTSIDVFVYPATDPSAVLRRARGGADVTQLVSFTLLQGEYFVVIEESAFNGALSIRSFDMTCFGAEDDFCSLSSSEVSVTMTIDLTGLPLETDVFIYSTSDTDNVLRTQYDQGGVDDQPKSYRLLHGDYFVQVVDGESYGSNGFVRTFEMKCFGKEGDTCSLSRSELSVTMSIDLSNLPQSTELRIYSPSDTDITLRRAFNDEVEQPKLFTLLQGTYLVDVFDHGFNAWLSKGYTLQCLGIESDTCSLSSADLVTQLTVDLSGLPEVTELEVYPENRVGILRRDAVAGGGLVSFTVLKSNYKISVVDDGVSWDLRFSLDRTLQCLGQDDDTCAVTNDEIVTEVSVDLSGLPGSTDVFIFHDDPDADVLRSYFDEGSGTRPVRTYVVLKTNYRLMIRDDGPEHSYVYVVPRPLQCLGQPDDTCFVSNSELVVDLSVDLTGQPGGTDVKIFEAGEEGKGAIRIIENDALGAQPRVYTLLKGDYTVFIVDDQAQVKQVGPLDCNGKQTSSNGDGGKCVVTSDEIGGGDTPFSRRRQSTSDTWRPSLSWGVVAVIVGGGVAMLEF